MSVFKVMNDDEIRDFCIKKDFKIFQLEQQLQQKENIIKEVRELLSKYNDNESNYYAPIDMALYLLDKENKE